MYGTIARVETDAGKIDELKALAQRLGTAPGQLGRLVYQMDANPNELFLVALFESRQAYWDNAQSPEQHARYQEMSALFASEPEWHDGAIVDALLANDVQSERNTAIVRRLFDEVINQEAAGVIDEIFAADVAIHDPLGGDSRGLDAFRQLMGMFDSAFPHHRVAVDAIISQGDFVAVLHTHTATNTGSFMGMAPTGKTVVVNGIELCRLRDGKIIEFWRKDDDAGMLMQLGMLPQPA